MKIFTRCLAFALLLGSLSKANADWVEDAVKQIRADYNATENAKLTKQTITLDDGPELIELTKYFRGNNLVKLVYVSGGDHGGSTDHFYFKNGALYFIYQSAGYWSFAPNSGEGATIDTGREQRIYFQNNKIIRHLVKEVKSRDGNLINQLLAKTPNLPKNDPESVIELSHAGYRLLNVTNPDQLENYLATQ